MPNNSQHPSEGYGAMANQNQGQPLHDAQTSLEIDRDEHLMSQETDLDNQKHLNYNLQQYGSLILGDLINSNSVHDNKSVSGQGSIHGGKGLGQHRNISIGALAADVHSAGMAPATQMFSNELKVMSNQLDQIQRQQHITYNNANKKDSMF